MTIPALAQTWANVTATCGINYQSPQAQNGFGRGVAWADFDNDGDIDLFAPEGAGGYIRLWLNNGSGVFTMQIVAAAMANNTNPNARSDHGCAAADFDNDGDQDVYVCQGMNSQNPPVGLPNLLYVNQGTNALGFVSFSEQAVARGVALTGLSGDSYCCSWGDYDRDGWLDLYVGDYLPPVVPPYACQNINATPLCYVANHTLFRNNRNGTFTDVTLASGTAVPGSALAVFWHDYNEDGWPDIHIINDRGGNFIPNRLMRNNRNGTFTDVAPSINAAPGIDAMGVTVGDMHNDGDWDVFVSNFSAGHILMTWNDANQNFDLPAGSYYTQAVNYGLTTGQLGWSSHFMDYDCDGWLDLFVMHQSVPNRMFRNLGTQPWTDVTATLFGPPIIGFNLMPWGRSSAIIDVDNDGDLDIFVPSESTQGQLIRNPGYGFNWLRVRTIGTNSNRDGIGTMLRATSASGTRRRMIVSAEGYLSDGDKRAHFGIGQDPVVTTLELRWPSGTVSYLHNVAPNQQINVVEPNFSVAGAMTPGSVNTVGLSLPSDVGRPYVAGLVYDATSEYYLPDNRAIRVNVNDSMLGYSTTFGNPLWGFYTGLLAAPNGTAAMTLSIPAIPQLSGLSAYFIAVTLDSQYPGSIKSIVGPQRFTIL